MRIWPPQLRISRSATVPGMTILLQNLECGWREYSKLLTMVLEIFKDMKMHSLSNSLVIPTIVGRMKVLSWEE